MTGGEKKDLQEEEVIDLTEVIQEGDPEKMRTGAGNSTRGRDDDSDEDLNDFFADLGGEQEHNKTGYTEGQDRELSGLLQEETRTGEGSLPESHARPDTAAGILAEPASRAAEESKFETLKNLEQQVVTLGERLEQLQDRIKIQEEQFQDRVLQAVEEKGEALEVIQAISTRIVDLVMEQSSAKIRSEINALRAEDLSELQLKLETLEGRIEDIKSYDIQAVKEELNQRIQEKIDTFREEQTQLEALSDLKQELVQTFEDRIQEIETSWQNEKKTLVSWLEDSTSWTFLSRTDVDQLVSSLRQDLEERLQQQIPAAASRVIREEIVAMLQEQQDQD